MISPKSPAGDQVFLHLSLSVEAIDVQTVLGNSDITSRQHIRDKAHDSTLSNQDDNDDNDDDS